MHTADNLKDALLKDHANKTVQNTQDMLTDLGLAVWPHHTKIAYALKKYYKCPVEFLLKLYQLNRSKNEIAGSEQHSNAGFDLNPGNLTITKLRSA